MGLNEENTLGTTLLDEDEKEGLKISSVSTRGELDEFEQLNIEKAISWTLGKKFKADDIFSEEFIRELHSKMFGDVWLWAGQFRKTNKNLGVDKEIVGISLKQLNDDCMYWLENKIFSEDEIAIRYKHQLVSIHCFANGNGRHSRLIADIIIHQVFGKPLFTWGINRKSKIDNVRSTYLQAIKAADMGDMKPLILFARS